MRVACLVGMFKPACYKDGVIDTSYSPNPSVFNVVLQYARLNSDRAYFYIVTGRKSETPGKIEYLPIDGINGVLVVAHLPKLIGNDLSHLVTPTAHLFNYDRTLMPVDAIVTVLPNAISGLRETMKTGTAREIGPALVLRVTEGIVENLFEKMGYMLADKVVIAGLHMKDDLIQGMKNDFSFARLKTLQESFEYVTHGIPTVDKVLDFDRERAIGFFGRLSITDKKIDKNLEYMDKLYSADVVKRVIVTSSKEKDKHNPLLQKYPYVEFSVEKQDYVLKAEQVRCVIALEVGVGAPVGMLELMSRGVLPVVCTEKRSWVKPFFDSELPDYPFLFETDDEMYGMIKSIMENDGLYKKYAKMVAEYAQKNYDITVLKRKLHDTIVDTAKKVLDTTYMTQTLEELVISNKQIEKIVEIVIPSLGDNFSFSSFLKAVQKANVVLVTPVGFRYIDNRSLYRIVELCGYKDTLNKRIPFFVKKESVL